MKSALYSYANKLNGKYRLGFIYALSRSFVALGTLITLVCNSSETLFYFESLPEDRYPHLILSNFSLFSLVDPFIGQIISIGVLIIVISGFLPRLTGILHFWITLSFYLACPIIDGGDQLSVILSFLFIPLTLFDNRINHWTKYHFDENAYLKNIFVSSTMIIVQIQMAFLYFHATIAKLRVEEWLDGTALFYWFGHPLYGMPEYLYDCTYFLFSNKYIIPIITWSILILEYVLSVSFLFKDRNKQRVFKVALLFHIGIVIIHGLISFFFAMLGGLVLYLLLNSKLDKYYFENFKLIKNGE